jgi:tRNA ligase
LNAQLDGWDNKLGDCKIMLEKVVWDPRIMAIVARIVDDTDWQCVNAVAHITVGTRGDDVKPKESNDLLSRWLESGSGDATGIGEVAIEERPVLNGAVKAVMSRMR